MLDVTFRPIPWDLLGLKWEIPFYEGYMMYDPCFHHKEPGGPAIQFSICLYNAKRRKQEVGWPLPSYGRPGQMEHLDALHLMAGWARRRANRPGQAERWQVRPGERWQAGLDSVLAGRVEQWHPHRHMPGRAKHPLRHMPGRAKPGCVALRLHQHTKQKLWQI